MIFVIPWLDPMRRSGEIQFNLVFAPALDPAVKPRDDQLRRGMTAFYRSEDRVYGTV